MERQSKGLFVVCVLALVSLLVLATQLFYASSLTSRYAERLDRFLGMAGISLLPVSAALWRRWGGGRDGTGAPRPRTEWLAELARAERERIEDDLRFRGVEVAPIAARSSLARTTPVCCARTASPIASGTRRSRRR